mmetsp:Transcript_12647/g.17945  ORF Transcript_12647/g.17945 Transcript_12647/m.17945 type:complete len:130 (-) Transcript_12647:2204-2593(-)
MLHQYNIKPTGKMHFPQANKYQASTETKRKVSMSIPVPKTDTHYHNYEDFDCQRYDSLTWNMYQRITAARALKAPVTTGHVSHQPTFKYLCKNQGSTEEFHSSNSVACGDEPMYSSDSSEYGDIFDMDI